MADIDELNNIQEESPEREVVADNKYGQLSSDIVSLLEGLERTHFREDKPVDFCGLKIYPAKVRDFEVFSMCTSCLTLNKNLSREGITMSHLDYLLSRTQIKENNEGQAWSYKIQKLCELIFHITNGLKCKGCGRVIPYDSEEFKAFVSSVQQITERIKTEAPENLVDITPPSLKCPECDGTEFIEMIKIVQNPKNKSYSLCVDGQTISNKDFTKLRQIVLYQNFYDYVDDSWVDPAIKADHDERMKLEQQKNDVHASIEKKAICLSIATNYKIDDIYDMSIRRFTLALATVDDLINYKIMKQAVASGFASLPEGKTVEHWIYKPNKDMYGDSYKSTEELSNSISNL